MSRAQFTTGSSDFAQNYVNTEMTNGAATVAQMRFPRPGGGGRDPRSAYGMWGMDNSLGPA